MAPDPANFLNQLPQKESVEKLYGSRSRQLSSSAPSKRIWRKIIWLQIPPTLFISSLKKNLAKNYMAPDPANFKNLAKNYMAPDPANFPISTLKKNLVENYMAPDPANFLHQLPQKESGGKLYGSRSRQVFHQLPQKEFG